MGLGALLATPLVFGVTVGKALLTGGLFAFSTLTAKRRNANLDGLSGASISVKQSDAPRKLVYGRRRVGTLFADARNTGKKNRTLWIPMVLCDGPIQALESIYFNDEIVPFNEDGTVTEGKYKGLVTLQRFLGEENQAAWQEYIDNAPDQWDSKGSFRERRVFTTVFGPINSRRHFHQWSSTDPSAADVNVGNPTRYHLNYTTGEWFAGSLARVWVSQGFIEAEGSTWHNGRSLPADGVAAIGDFFFNTDSGLWFQKSANKAWTVDHKLSGIAYLGLKVNFDFDAFPRGLPQISAVIQGINTVQDPRDSSTGWSDNPALCLAHYMSDSKFGLNVPLSKWGNLDEAASICDELVTLKSGESERRYTMGGEIRTDVDHAENIRNFLESMSARLAYTNGKFYLYPGKYVTPTFTVTADMLAGPVRRRSTLSQKDRVNQVKGVYLSEVNEWQPTDYPIQENSDAITQDKQTLPLDLDLEFVGSNSQSQRLAKIRLNEARQDETVDLICNLKAFPITAGQPCKFTFDFLGYSEKEFLCIESSLAPSPGGEIQVKLALREYSSTIYDWDPSTDEKEPIVPFSEAAEEVEADDPIPKIEDEEVSIPALTLPGTRPNIRWDVAVVGVQGEGEPSPTNNLPWLPPNSINPRLNRGEIDAVASFNYEEDEDNVNAYSKDGIALPIPRTAFGSQIYTGADAPAEGLGKKLDFYVRTTNGDYYEKTSSTVWTSRGNLQGPAGATGPQGPTGATGAAGAQGPAGTDGADGSDGATGPAGATGATGPQGPAGATGAAGAQGPAGTDGADGSDGNDGAKWYNGTTAPSNGTGVVGDHYINTNSGEVYEKTGASSWTYKGDISGAPGATGPQGPAGNDGADGAAGATGPQGPAGATGAAGAAGPQGPAGATGSTGPQGPTGATGATGPAGPAPPKWLVGTAYAVDDVVYNDETSHNSTKTTAMFKCYNAHTATSGDQPGVGASWQDEWICIADTIADVVSSPSGSGAIVNIDMVSGANFQFNV